MNRLAVINRYFNHGYFNKTGKAIAFLSLKSAIKYGSHEISGLNTITQAPDTDDSVLKSAKYNISRFEPVNPELRALIEYVNKNLSHYLHSALVHGSVATNEVINYSDFDGLIILKNEVFKSPASVREVCLHLNRTFAMMVQFDPLQHHGWMVVTESDLQEWPSIFFPPELFEYSKSILNQETTISIDYRESKTVLKENFLKYAGRLIKVLESGSPIDSAYGLKSLLSEFMLLPSLYVAARDGKGIFKKHSFKMAAADFTDHQWAVMNRISEIRSQWPSKKNHNVFKSIKSFTPLTRNKQIKESRLPLGILAAPDPVMIRNMIELANLMKRKFQ
jgi:hypothetical protein